VAKYTEQKSYSLKKAYLESFVETALKKGKIPALIVRFDPEGVAYAVIRYDDFLALDQYITEENSNG
jgi:hypothetical protein